MHDFSHFRYNRGVGRLCEAMSDKVMRRGGDKANNYRP